MLSDKDHVARDAAHPGSNGGREDQMTGNTAQVQCSFCSSTFRRPEHLKRHLRSHTKEKPFECAQCGRHFSRTDTLHRHELSHHMPGLDGGKNRAHRITVKTFRACFKCAAARVRCSGGIPCGRCDNRSLQCQYPTERRSKARTRRASLQESSVAGAQEDHVKIAHGPLHAYEGDTQANSNAKPKPQTHQVSQFHVHDLHSPHLSPNNPSAVPNPIQSHQEENVSVGSDPVMTPAHSCSYFPDSRQASAGGQLPLPHCSNDERHHEYHGISSSGLPISVEATTGMNAEIRHMQTGLPNIEAAIADNQDISLDFDPSFFDQSMLSTINWLPPEFLAGAANDQTQSSLPPACSPPTFPDASLARATWQPPVITAGQTSPSMPENVAQTPSGHLSLATDMGSPNHYSHMLSEASPHSESVDSAKRSADYYVDGAGARLPKYRKKQTRWSQTSVEPVDIVGQQQREDSYNRHSFPKIHEIPMENLSEDVNCFSRSIESSTYDEIYRHFLALCRNEHSLFAEFESVHFPSAHECTQFMTFYLDCFQAVYPILHLPTFDPNQCHWLLTLAVVAIGCHAANIPETAQCITAFHEMIRRALILEKEKSCSAEPRLDILQAMLLNCIGSLFSGSERAKFHALSAFGDLVTLMNHEKLLVSSQISKVQPNRSEQESTWMAWVRDETRRRTGYCIWLVDSTLAYSFDHKPLLALDDGQVALPATEKLWQAISQESWRRLWEKSTVNESLYDAVHCMYIEKRLVSGVGEFSHILLIHAIYQRMWEVGEYFRRPLSFWNPTAQKQNRETAVPTGSVWLPGIPSYSKWRNSACDCLDILHWTANSTIAKAAGLEHPTVLHLHAARVVLLAPFREIRSLAAALATEKLPWSRRYQAIEWQYIWRWTKHDQYKARLSIIHAGTTLWHVRRYSTNAFHEPVATFLAVLTLWAYGSCYAHEAHHHESRPEPSHDPSFIHLDRPCDDELVQLFVREGHAMRGNVTGVGDICAPDGPERILRVGCETLSSLSAWGISRQLISILSRLADLVAYHSITSDRNQIST